MALIAAYVLQEEVPISDGIYAGLSCCCDGCCHALLVIFIAAREWQFDLRDSDRAAGQQVVVQR